MVYQIKEDLVHGLLSQGRGFVEVADDLPAAARSVVHAFLNGLGDRSETMRCYATWVTRQNSDGTPVPVAGYAAVEQPRV